MREVALLLKRVAPADATDLLLGESGVGKTAFARQLHRWSQPSVVRKLRRHGLTINRSG